MAKNRTSATKASDRQAVARMLLEGQSIRTIADVLGRSTATVQSDVNELRREWTASARETMKEHLSVELAKLNHVERQMYGELSRIVDPVDRLTGYEKIGKLVCRRCDVLGLKNLADAHKAEAEVQEAFIEIKRRVSFALEQIFTGDSGAYRRFIELFQTYDPAEAEAKALADLKNSKPNPERDRN